MLKCISRLSLFIQLPVFSLFYRFVFALKTKVGKKNFGDSSWRRFQGRNGVLYVKWTLWKAEKRIRHTYLEQNVVATETKENILDIFRWNANELESMRPKRPNHWWLHGRNNKLDWDCHRRCRCSCQVASSIGIVAISVVIYVVVICTVIYIFVISIVVIGDVVDVVVIGLVADVVVISVVVNITMEAAFVSVIDEVVLSVISIFVTIFTHSGQLNCLELEI